MRINPTLHTHLALVGGTIHTSPAEEPVQNGVVLVNDDKIAAVGSRAQVQIPPGAQMLDCSGRTITAGFWDSHVHFMASKWANVATIRASALTQQLRELSGYGFTTVFDLSSIWENTRQLRHRIEAGEVVGPRICSTGLGLLLPHPGLPADAIINLTGTSVATVRTLLRQSLESGVDGIKLCISSPTGPSLPHNIIQAVVSEVHRVGKPVFAHPNTSADVIAAVRCGVDVIAHTTPHSGPWHEVLRAAMTEQSVALTPTLWFWKWYARRSRQSAPDKIVNSEISQLRAWLAARGTVLFGTNIGAGDPDPTEEYKLMAEAGMSFRQILASLTTAPAERFQQSPRLGRIAAGLQADLVVLRKDPSQNIEALADVEYTLRAGKIIYQAEQRTADSYSVQKIA